MGLIFNPFYETTMVDYVSEKIKGGSTKLNHSLVEQCVKKP